MSCNKDFFIYCVANISLRTNPLKFDFLGGYRRRGGGSVVASNRSAHYHRILTSPFARFAYLLYRPVRTGYKHVRGESNVWLRTVNVRRSTFRYLAFLLFKMTEIPTNGVVDAKEKKNVIVNYIPPHITEAYLQNMFITCGKIIGCKLMRDKTNGVSLGYAFVNYNTEAEAARAIEMFDGHQLDNKKIRVSYARPSSEEIKNANLYISGLPKAIGESDLKTWFAVYGTIISSKILLLESGESRGVGFIRYDKRAEAQAAIDALNGVTVAPGSTLAVKFANPPKGISSAQLQSVSMLPANEVLRPELNLGGVGPIHHGTTNNRFSPLGAVRNSSNYFTNQTNNQNHQSPAHQNSKTNCHCIFVYGLPTSEEDIANELLLYKLFSPHGAIFSVSVKKGTGYAFVNMIRYDEALRAVTNLNGYFVQQHNTHLQVSFKKCKP